MSKRFFPMFSSRSFMVSGLIFKSLIHLGLTFEYDMREQPSVILLHVAVSFLNTVY